jgi:hypothetical protein
MPTSRDAARGSSATGDRASVKRGLRMGPRKASLVSAPWNVVSASWFEQSHAIRIVVRDMNDEAITVTIRRRDLADWLARTE